MLMLAHFLPQNVFLPLSLPIKFKQCLLFLTFNEKMHFQALDVNEVL